jgi:hypothetical protein
MLATALSVGAQVGCAAPTPRGPEVGPVVAARTERSALGPNLRHLAGPPPFVEERRPRGPALVWVRRSGAIEAIGIREWQVRTDPLPFAVPAALRVRPYEQRTVVTQPGGWLVAINRGEFGGGLFWVDRTTLQPRRLDASLASPIHWVGVSGTRIFGFVGLCHGESCTHQTTVFEVVDLLRDHNWQLDARRMFDGCPGAIEEDAVARTIVVAAGCGSLVVIDGEARVHPVVPLPAHLTPINLVVDHEPGAASATYYVSFGRTLAVVRGDEVEWFEPAL